jgi:heterodisulfide reductase subunit A
MARIGIFIDALKGSIAASVRERIIATLQGLPDILFCIVEEDLTSPEGLERMAKRLESGEVDRVVIIGGSPKIYESSFHKWRHPLPFNPYLFVVADVREQVLWAMVDEETALERANAAIIKTIRMATASKPIETQSLPLKLEVLVLGGGITGISIAHALATSGVHVTLLEKRKSLGGRASELRRFYNRPEGVQKWIEEKVSEVHQTSSITLITQAELKRRSLLLLSSSLRDTLPNARQKVF